MSVLLASGWWRGRLPIGVAPVVARAVPLGFGNGVWDVAMNVEGADVERRLGRTIMPRFHAGFSIGTVVGALLGAADGRARRLRDRRTSSASRSIASRSSLAVAVRDFLPVDGAGRGRAPSGRAALAGLAEPRTLLIGVFVLGLAFTEGTANDWLGVALIDGYDARAAVGVARRSPSSSPR